MWPNTTLIELLGIELPIIQAPMAGASGVDMAVAVGEAGGLGSLPCAMLDPATARSHLQAIRQRSAKPLNVNFFAHEPYRADPRRDRAWKAHLAPYYEALGVDPATAAPSAARTPFDAAMCEVVEEFSPKVVSFHFGLPAPSLVERVRATGAVIAGSATTVMEARWLEDHGCDVIIAQGCEAGGHRGMFLSDDIATQPGTFALVPQVASAVRVPVVAAGGIVDGRGIAAAFALGAAAVQIGTAYLLTPESLISDLHRQALRGARDDSTALSNVFTGRPARGILNRVMREVGPMSPLAPAFPAAGAALAPLKAASERSGSSDFSAMWSGQCAPPDRDTDAAALTRFLAQEALEVLGSLAPTPR